MKKFKQPKINPQQTRIMTEAGFVTHEGWEKGNLFDISYWKRGDLLITWPRAQKVTLSELVKRVAQQAKYWSTRDYQVKFHEPKFDN